MNCPYFILFYTQCSRLKNSTLQIKIISSSSLRYYPKHNCHEKLQIKTKKAKEKKKRNSLKKRI